MHSSNNSNSSEKAKEKKSATNKLHFLKLYLCERGGEFMWLHACSFDAEKGGAKILLQLVK